MRKGALLRLRLVTASRPTYEASPSFASALPRNCRRQTRPPSACSCELAKQTPPPTPLHVRGCCTACRLNLTLSRHKFKFNIFEVRVSATQICKFDFKFERKTMGRSIFVFTSHKRSQRSACSSKRSEAKLRYEETRRI